jgi:hypothetical protein
MDSFQIAVLGVAAIVLIIILSVIGVVLGNLKNKVVYPPIANQCPDYWKVASDNVSCTIPAPGALNTGKIRDPITGYVTFTVPVPGYDASSNTINFTDPGWVLNNSSVCNQKLWATQYGVVWDGVSNYNSC